ncbi:MAG: hypothetical protein JSS24_13840 [Proteobacteria bacterium]|nr:hypothetical protein [Pseudomonadota bacterium]
MAAALAPAANAAQDTKAASEVENTLELMLFSPGFTDDCRYGKRTAKSRHKVKSANQA